MTANLVALLVGLFALPLYALWLGHRLQRRSARQRGAFWGLVAGHTIGALVATVAAMLPAEFWHADGMGRIAVTFWSMAVMGVVGMVVGMMRGREEGIPSEGTVIPRGGARSARSPEGPTLQA